MTDSDIHDSAASYALHALDADERSAFESHLEGCTRCLEAVTGLQEAAAALALDVEPREPPPELRARILAEIDDSAALVPLPRRRPAVLAAAVLAVAAACAAVAFGVWSIVLAHSLSHERNARRGQGLALAILADPNARRFPLSGARGAVVVTPARAAALVVSNLAPAPRTKTYEIWVVGGEGPQPAGLIRGGASVAVALSRLVPTGSRVAVSLERAGGVDHLTGRLLFGARTG